MKTIDDVKKVRKGLVIIEMTKQVSELELGNKEIRFNYSPGYPNSWDTMKIVKKADDVTEFNIGDDVVIFEHLRFHNIEFPGNTQSVSNLNGKIGEELVKLKQVQVDSKIILSRNEQLERDRELARQLTEKKHIVKEYIIGGADVISFNW